MSLEHQAFMGPLEDAVIDHQHDPDLCARVARVMGIKHKVARMCEWTYCPNRVGHKCCNDRNEVYMYDDRDLARWCTPFRPDTDPADAWRVLEWTQQKYDVHFDVNCDDTHSVTLYDHTLCITHDEARGATRAAALCNAVAALGGEK